jgi:Putative beta barrel porin-7 (BBP7)
MRYGWLCVLGAYLFSASSVSAQIFPVPPAPADFVAEFIPSSASPVHAVFEPIQGYHDTFRFWAQADCVVGWVREAPAPLPLATSGDSKKKLPGAIGQPGTTVLFGNSGIGFRTALGPRLTLGAWLDAERNFGVEGGGYVVDQRVNNFIAQSNDTGSPLLAIPFVKTTSTSAAESAHLISNPKKVVGDILVASSLERWGTEMNGVYCFWRQPGLELSLLAGMRYENLQESMRILQHSFTLANKTNTTFDDHFDTFNRFYGGQIGGRVHWQYDVWVVEVSSKIALGGMHQLVDVQGDSSQYGPKASPAGSFPSGFFAQASNTGQRTANPLVAMPSLQAKLGYQITPHLRFSAGYGILYWNQVVRPGDQIDRNINLTQSPILGATNGTLVGPALPAPLFHRSGYWAQDVNFGLELRF